MANEFLDSISPAKKIRHISFDTIFNLSDSDKLFGNYHYIEKAVEEDFLQFKNFVEIAYKKAQQTTMIGARFNIVDKNKEYGFKYYWFEIVIKSKLVNNVVVSDEAKLNFSKEIGAVIVDIPLEKISINGIAQNPLQKNNNYFIKSDVRHPQIILNDNELIQFDLRIIEPNAIEYYGKTFQCSEQKVYLDNFTGPLVTYTSYPFLDNEIIKNSNKEKLNESTLELIDDENNSTSVYDIFFDDDVTAIYFEGNKDKKYEIVSKNKAYGQITIKHYDVFDNNKKIFIENDLYKLLTQRRAIDMLLNRPSYHHKALITLGDNVEKSKLQSNLNIKILEEYQFKVLTRNELKGNSLQRDFVNKALSTPDFMILEGPPGSGKTTAILEFIYQAIKDGKKVLLAASTHVAIDNVLEKIIKHKDSNELLKLINPVRIGDEKNVYVPEVQPFCYKNIMEKVPEEFRNIVEESFNLVCGTTIGVLQFPLIKSIFQSNIEQNNFEPLFDYLIIDEASKTTFSEFLVPAVLAKKWIIVGDVKQLSPYVDETSLTPTLLASKALNNISTRKAIQFLVMLENNNFSMQNHVFVMSISSINHVDQFIAKNKFDSIVSVSNLKTQQLFNINLSEIKEGSYKLSALTSPGQVIIVEEDILSEILPYLGSSYQIISSEYDYSDLAYYEKFKIMHHRKPKFSSLDSMTSKVDDAFKEKLENEIIWRIKRIYELTYNNENRSTDYQKYIEQISQFLSPEMANEYQKDIAMLQEIAIPSIIMLLQNGIKKRSQNSKKTILNSGLSEIDKINRFASLSYQYRMHHDISKVSRKFVYNDQALKDDQRTFEPFQYINNHSRFEIRNVVSKEVKRNVNKEEANEIMKEFKSYLDSKPKKGTKIAILAFYNGQVMYLRNLLQKHFNTTKKYNFSDGLVDVTLNTVDKFQGQEADIVYLSMVQNEKIGFLDSVNRMNVAITRAKEKLIIFGNKAFFSHQNKSEILRNIFKEIY